MKQNRLLILKDKKEEIFEHFKVRPSKKAFNRFDCLVDSDDFVGVVRWANKATNKTLGLRYLKLYFEELIGNQIL
jgi:hypothetical protein